MNPFQKDSGCDRTPRLSSRRRFLQFTSVAGTSAVLSRALHGIRGMQAIATPILSQSTASNAPIRMGVVGLSFYRVVGGVIQNVLEPMGYTVEITEGPHLDIFPELSQGNLDMLVAVWLPTGHGPLMDEYGNGTSELSLLYEDARFFWGVPDYLPEDIQTLADLARPEVATQINSVIQGIGPGAGITRLSQEIMTRYNLETAGYEFRTGTPQEWVGAFQHGVDAGEGVIIPLWQPQYLNQAYEIRRLADPLGVLPAPDRCSLVVTDAFRDRLPSDVIETLSRISLGVDTVTAMDYLTNVDGLSPREAATQWMEENPEIVQSWLTTAL